MVAQQTVLRAELNDVTATVSGTTDLDIIFSGSTSYSGTGTNEDPYIGTIQVITDEDIFYEWVIDITNNGDSGTLYYEFNLPAYSGTSQDLFNKYYLKTTYNDAQPFIEYDVSNIEGSITFNSDDVVSFVARLRYTAPNSTFVIYFIPDDVPQENITTYEVLDLYSNIPITINKSFAELEDIGKRNSDYSVGLKLPGSKKNNRFFENFYDVDSATLFFDVTKRVSIKVLVDDESYLTGYMRLNKVNVLDSKVEYDVTLFSSVADLFGKIGNELLKDLDFNDPEYHFNHYFTLYNIIGEWQNSYFQNSLNEMPLYMYPVLHNGYLYNGSKVNFSGGTAASQSRFYTSTAVGSFANYAAFTGATGAEFFVNSPKKPLLTNQLKPSLSVWGLIELMFKSYGYTIKSDFFNTPWFKALYIYGYFSSDTTKFGYQVQTPQSLAIEDVEILFVETLIDETVTCGGSPQIKTTRTYTIYVVKTGTGIPCLASSAINANLKFRLFKCDSAIGTDYTQDIIIPAGSTGTTYSWVSNGPYPIQPGVSSGCAPCAFEYQQNFVDLTTSNVGVTTRALAYTPQTPGTFVNYQDGDAVNFNEVIDPKIKQIDFLSSIAKKYNLLFIPNPQNPNEIIIEPYDYYVGTGNILDWTDKLSFDKGFTVEPALNYIESELLLTDLEDGDDANKQFKEQNNRIYGENYVYNQTDFKSQQKKIDTIFGPEIIRKWDNNIGMPLGINYSASSDLDSTTNTVNYVYKGVKTKPKLMFNLGNFNPFLDQVGETIDLAAGRVNTQFFRVQQSDGTNPLDTEYAIINTSNPIITHTMPLGNPDTNKINNDSLCILFNSEQPATLGVGYPTYNAYTENDMYNTFYINRVNNLYNKSTRFLSANFYLKLSDVKNLKPNDLIKINNQYFTWNKIQQYNLTNTDLTKVELIQYNSEYSTYPNRFFKYEYCNAEYVYKFRTYLNPADNPDSNNNNSLFYTYYFWSVFYDYMVGALGGNVSGITSSFLWFNRPLSDTVSRLVYTMTEITEAEYNTIEYSHTDDYNDIFFISYNSDRDRPSLNIQDTNTFLYCWPLGDVAFFSRGFFNVAANCEDFITLCEENDIPIYDPEPPITLTPTPTPTQTYMPTPTPSVTRTPAICITHTPTPTATSTVTPTITPAITATPTFTPSPTPTPNWGTFINCIANTTTGCTSYKYSGTSNCGEYFVISTNLPILSSKIFYLPNSNVPYIGAQVYSGKTYSSLFTGGTGDWYPFGITQFNIGILPPTTRYYYYTYFAQISGSTIVDFVTCVQPTPTPTRTPAATATPTRTPTPTVTSTITPTISLTPTITPVVSLTPSVTPTITSTVTPTVTSTITLTATPTITPTITPTLTVTPSSTPVPNVLVQTDNVYVYQYTLSGNTNTLLFDPETELVNDVALGNNNFYTLISTDGFSTGFTINQYTSTLSPLSITTGVTDSWTVYDGDYPGLDGSYGLEIKDDNTLLVGGSSIYELNISASTFNLLFDLAYPDSYVIGDFIYNPYTNRIIMLAYGQDFTTYNITEYYMNGTIYATYEFTYDFGTYVYDGITYNKAPAALFVNNNNLYMSTDWNRDIYQINLSTGAPTYVQSITGGTYNLCAGFGAPNQCNNVSLSPSPTFTPTPTITPTISVTPTITPSTSISTYTYLGRTTPDAANSTNACSTYLTVRGYTSLVSSLSSINVGDIIYDSYPSSPTNGNNNWVALKSGGVGSAYSFQINTVGEVTAIGGICS
jgi:hypothetical protein